MISDLRQTIRALLRSPGWTLAATSILALGVAANTTVFSWVRSVVLDPIPGASQPARLRVLVARTAAGDVTRMSYPDFRDLAASTPVFDGLIAQRWTGAGFGTPGTGSSQVISCSLVSADYFGVLGVAPTLGRGFRTEEGAGRGSAPVAVVSDALWRRSLRSDPAVVGKTILVNAQPFTVVGVAPPGFYGSLLGIGTDVWIPLVQIGRVDPAADRLENRADRWLLTLARLKPGVDTEQADAALASAQSRLNQTYPGIHDGGRVSVVPLSRSPWGGPAELGQILLTLAALVSLVLLIACANVANLLINRALGRRREIATRMALGASPARIRKQLLLESVLLSALAAAASLVAAFWTSGLLLAFIPPTGMPVRMNLSVDGRVVLFALAISLAANLLCSLVPSLQAGRTAVAADLTGGSRTVAGERGRARLRSVLVAAQIALSTVLLVAAGLFLRSLTSSRRTDPGFDNRNILLVDLKLFAAGYSPQRGAALLEDLTERVSALPGVESCAVARRAPLGFGGFGSRNVTVEGYVARPGEEVRPLVDTFSPGYLRLLRLPLLKGREFEVSDRAGAEPVALVNAEFERRYLGGRSAVGARMTIDNVRRRVVGVAGDARLERLDGPPLAFVFLPLAQDAQSEVALHVRTLREPISLLPAVRESVRRLDPNLPLFEVQTMEQHFQEEVFSQRIASTLLGSLGLLAVLISGVGLYALAAFSVAERRREIGVRMALGAGPRRLVRAFMIRTLRLCVAGGAAGLAASLAVGRAIAGDTPGVDPSDPLTFAAVGVLVSAVALVASFLPASRAARMDPVVALRSD